MDDRRATDAESTGPVDPDQWPPIDVAALPHLDVVLTHADEPQLTWSHHRLPAAPVAR